MAATPTPRKQGPKKRIRVLRSVTIASDVDAIIGALAPRFGGRGGAVDHLVRVGAATLSPSPSEVAA